MTYGCQQYDINRLCRFDRRAIDRSCDGCPRTTDKDYLTVQGLWVAGVSHQEGGSGETEESKMEWKPIETVPTDTPILITDGKIVTVTVLNVTVLNKCGDDPKWMHGHGFSGYEWQYDFMINQATHWMPLPQPPVVE